MRQKSKGPEITIRLMQQQDNSAVTRIIWAVMTEFEATGCGFSVNDPEVQDMFSAYNTARAAFYVVEKDGEVLGCGGFAPLEGGDTDTCELRKMYFMPELRGTGMGAGLLQRILDDASKAGFHCCYLETMESMEQARNLYHKHGFRYLDARMGDTGHGACSTWMATTLSR